MTRRPPEGPAPAAAGHGAAKSPTGIAGFDEITGGGIPDNRVTAVYGGTGTGKTVFAIQCLAHFATRGLPGVFLTFGETASELRDNAKAQGVDLPSLESSGRLVLDCAVIDPDEVTAAGGHALDGVFVRLEQAIERIQARLVVIDAINVLSQNVLGPATGRADLRRFLSGLKRRGITTVVTIEVADLHDLNVEEHLADCVVFLRNSVQRGIATRTLRVVKYRGGPHRINEYPFIIASGGLVVTPATAAVQQHPSSTERVPMGIAGLDAMLGGGVYRGDTVFVTGSAGSGKTTFTVALGMAACRRGERCLFIAMEEPPSQLIRNMAGIGFDLRTEIEAGRLHIDAPPPSLEGLEAHLAFVLREVDRTRPDVVVVDPLTPLMALGEAADVRETIIRLLGIIKSRGITVVCTLLARERYLEEQNTPFASFVDDIILLTNQQDGGARTRALSVLKARGIPHSSNVHPFRFTPAGVEVGPALSRSPPARPDPGDDEATDGDDARKGQQDHG